MAKNAQFIPAFSPVGSQLKPVYETIIVYLPQTVSSATFINRIPSVIVTH